MINFFFPLIEDLFKELKHIYICIRSHVYSNRYLRISLISDKMIHLSLDRVPDVEELPVLHEEEVVLGGQLLQNVPGS